MSACASVRRAAPERRLAPAAPTRRIDHPTRLPGSAACKMLQLVRIADDVHRGDALAVELKVTGLDRAVADIDHIAQRAVDDPRHDLGALGLLVAHADKEARDL